MGFSSSGLPIGTQFTAAYGREDILLALAAQIERAQPWRHQRAPIWG
jgi:amidase|tara:strand:+ start:2040 stop:2180 length:141 start_codon:yes stop_codon:yes gene_type:complete